MNRDRPAEGIGDSPFGRGEHREKFLPLPDVLEGMIAREWILTPEEYDRERRLCAQPIAAVTRGRECEELRRASRYLSRALALTPIPR
jgi:hypothetical protein